MTIDLRRKGLKSNFSWTAIGSAVYHTTQWLVLVCLAKLVDPKTLGEYVLATAICTPIMVLASMRLRTVLVTDATNSVRFQDAVGLQLVLGSMGILIIFGIATLFADSSQWIVLMVLVGLSQFVVVSRELFVALAQKRERLDRAAISKMLLGVTSLITFASVIALTGSLSLGVFGTLIGRLVIVLWFDVYGSVRVAALQVQSRNAEYFAPSFRMQRLSALLWLALPLGIASIVQSSFVNVPRYFIASYIDDRALGFFAAVFGVAMIGRMVVQAASQATLRRLSTSYIDNVSMFTWLLSKLFIGAGVLGVTGLALSVEYGEVILTVLYTEEYAEHAALLNWAMVFAFISYFGAIMSSAVAAMRLYQVQIIGNMVAVGAALILGWYLIPSYGIVAGAWCLVGGALAQLAVYSAVLHWKVSGEAKLV